MKLLPAASVMALNLSKIVVTQGIWAGTYGRTYESESIPREPIRFPGFALLSNMGELLLT
jgi:hypothetical protein